MSKNKGCKSPEDRFTPSGECDDEDISYVLPDINTEYFQTFVTNKNYNPKAHVRAYTITTIEANDGEIHQRGSAPNFKGNKVTLSTCKHDMRKTLHKNYWRNEDIWVAGFAKSGLRKKRDFSDSILLFLGKVEQIHETFYDVWNKVDENTRLEKDASEHPLGDFYKPDDDLKEPSLKANDFKKCSNHSHGEDNFEKDVNTGLIFVFDSDKTFVFGPQGKEIEDKKHFERKTGLEGYLTERNRIDRYGRKTNLGNFITGITGG